MQLYGNIHTPESEPTEFEGHGVRDDIRGLISQKGNALLKQVYCQDLSALERGVTVKVVFPHEPNEDLMTVEEAFADAEQSEARWRVFEQGQKSKPVLIQLPEPVYTTLEQLAVQQDRTVPAFIGQLIESLTVTFAPSPSL